MSVVRRPGRCSSFDIIPKITNQSPSKASIIKSEATKRYLEQYWNNVDQRKQSRDERMDDFVQMLEASSLNEEERNAALQEFTREETNFTRLSRTRLKPSNYNFISLIGRGGYADVWLVTDKKTNQISAMKIIRKSDVILSDAIEAVRNERNILAIAKNPWIVKLYCSFQDEEHLYLVLQFIQGGDLMNALVKCRMFPATVAKFFCGEIALALHSVHELGFIHSDLKPDNILLDVTGHIKLTDFGIASQYGKNDSDYNELLSSSHELMLDSKQNIMSMANSRGHRNRDSIIGTVDYTAPEVLMGNSQTVKSDWWSLGIILYEMLYGFTPFACESKKETVLRIINWRKSLYIPAGQKVPLSALELIKHLLCDEEDRYGFEEIVRHPFLQGFNFDDPFASKTPVKPNCKDPLDTSHFDKFEVNPEELRASSTLTELANFAFLGFTYKAKPPSVALARLGVSV